MKYNGKIKKEQIVGSLVWKLLERLGSQGISIVVQIVLARLILPEEFGSLAIVVAITNFAMIFVQSGLSTVIIQREEIDELDISTLLVSSLSVAGVLYAILFGAAPLIASYYEAPELIWVLRAQGLILFLVSIQSIQTAVLSRRMQFKKIFYRTMIAVPVSGLIGIGMALAGMGLWALVIHHLSNVLITVLIMSFDKELRFRLRFSWSRAGKHYRFSVKILLTSLVCSVNDMLRTMIIGRRYSKTDLAYYDKGLTYSSYLTLTVNNALQSVLLPTFSSSQTQVDYIKELSRRACRMAAFVMVPVLLGVCAVSEPLVLLLFGENWLPCAKFLAIYCLLRLPSCLLSIDHQVYYALGRSGIKFWYELGLFLLNVSVLLITMQFGVWQIALGAWAVEYIGAFAIFCISRRVYGYTLTERVKDLLPPLLCGVGMGLGVIGVGRLALPALVLLVLQVAVGVVLYVGFSLLVNRTTSKQAMGFVRDGMKKFRRKQV